MLEINTTMQVVMRIEIKFIRDLFLRDRPPPHCMSGPQDPSSHPHAAAEKLRFWYKIYENVYKNMFLQY